LAYVGPGGAKSEHPFYFPIPVIWSEVQVKAVLHGLCFGNRNKKQAGEAIRCWAYLELVRVVHDRPPECLLPPPPQRGWVS
jgi:hypothetical protein